MNRRALFSERAREREGIDIRRATCIPGLAAKQFSLACF